MQDKKDRAKELYTSGFGSLAKVAKALEVSKSTVDSWKNRDKKNGEDWIKMSAIKKESACNQEVGVEKIVKVKKEKIKKEKINYIDEISKEYKLSNQQTEFAIYYGNGNSVQSSCLKAKYSKSYSLGRGWNMLENIGIKKIVEHIKKLRYENIMYNEKDILNQYIRIAQGDLGDYWDDQGEELKPFSEVDTGIIKEFSVKVGLDGSVEKKFKLESKHPALRAMGEHFGMFDKDKVNNSKSELTEALNDLEKKMTKRGFVDDK